VTLPLVIKFGGDALATPERIAGAARRIAQHAATQPVVAVASARRGVTDHLINLVERVRGLTSGGATGFPSTPATDRAIAAGELVSASLLAVGLEQLGQRATVLDAREAGLGSDGRPGDGRLVAVQPRRVTQLMDRGIVPVVTGFQGWYRGRLNTLGRGGSDVTAVALAAALGAERCELAKEVGGVHTADPREVEHALLIPRATHRFVAELAGAGARFIHHLAAEQAERDRIPLRFTSLEAGLQSATVVDTEAIEEEILAVVHGSGRRDFPAPADAGDLATVTLVSSAREVSKGIRAQATGAAAHSGVPIRGVSQGPHSLRFVVASADAPTLVRTLHAAVTERLAAPQARPMTFA
jgi:aspartokinase